MTECTYPHQSADVTVIGPECFASHPAPDDEGVVLCWRGRNFTPAPPPAAEPQCRWHRSRCETPSALCLVDCAPSPAAEPPHDLRDRVIADLAGLPLDEWDGIRQAGRLRIVHGAAADRLLAGVLAAMLAELRKRDAANPLLSEALRYYSERRTMDNPKGWAHVQRVLNAAIASGAISASSEQVAEAHEVLDRLVEGESSPAAALSPESVTT